MQQAPNATSPARSGPGAPRRAAAAAAALAVFGCTSQVPGPDAASPSMSASPSGPPAQSSSPAAGSRPGISVAALVGFWRVQAAGEDPGSVLRLGERMMLSRACGLLTGYWRMGGRNLFVGYLDDSTGSCALPVGSAAPAWLRQAERARRAGAGWQLTTPGGRVVATLIPTITPTVVPPVGSRWPAEFFTRPTAPPPTPRVTPSVVPVRKGPQGPQVPRPATAAAFVGRWVPVGPNGQRSPGRAYLTLSAGGDWKGSDGCNTSAGRWTVGDDGQVIAVAGSETAMGCPPVQVPTSGWLTSATRAVFTYRDLFLLRADERPIGWLTRSG